MSEFSDRAAEMTAAIGLKIPQVKRARYKSWPYALEAWFYSSNPSDCLAVITYEGRPSRVISQEKAKTEGKAIVDDLAKRSKAMPVYQQRYEILQRDGTITAD